MRTFVEYDPSTNLVFNVLQADVPPVCGYIVDVTSLTGPWLGRHYDPATGVFTWPNVVISKAQREMGQVRLCYETWQLWKATRAEAIARGLGAGILAALQNRENASWLDYAQALQDWAAAS